MKKLKIEGNKISDIIEFLSDGNVCKAQVVRDVDNRKIGFFVYEDYYFRTTRTVSCSVFLYQTELDSCEIAIVGSGGASAIGITWGAHKDVEKKIAESILKYCEKIGAKGYYISE